MKFKQLFKFFVCAIPLFVSVGLSAQLSDDNIKGLREAVAQKVNNLRKTKGLNPLIFNDTLRMAAMDQAKYMAENDLLTHFQNPGIFYAPKDRVVYRGGKTFDLVGENCLYSSPKAIPVNPKNIESIADEIFQTWKNSPGHYANMIDSEYASGDLGFAANMKKNIIYAAQVFGTKGYEVTGQLSSNAFGLSEDDVAESCDEMLRRFSNLIATLGNSLIIIDDKVILRDSDLNSFKKIFEHKNDGLAVDLVKRSQFPCDNPNKIDRSPIYDGVLLEPTYLEAMLNNNQAESQYRLITPIGKIPASFQTDEIVSASLVYIKEGKFCKNLYPIEVPSASYSLRPIKPMLSNPNKIALSNEGIVKFDELIYDFNTNSTTPIQLPEIPPCGNSVYSVNVRTYSSIEGDSIKNVALFKARTESIKNHLKQNLKISDDKITIDSKENWDKMKFQLYYYELHELEFYSNNKLRKEANSNKNTSPWKEMLFEQRKATATINYWDKLPTSTTQAEIIRVNLRTAVQTKNSDLINKALYELYMLPLVTKAADSLLFKEYLSKTDSINLVKYLDLTDWSVLFEPSVMDLCKTSPELVVNYAAVLSKYYAYDIYQTADFLFYWFDKSEKLSKDAKYNLTNLYTLVGDYLLNNWDINSKRLSAVVHPDKVESFTAEITDEQLMLNVELTFLNYYSHINDYFNTNKSFDKIAFYFKTASLNPNDDVDLCRFYNNWSMFHLTVNHLREKFKSKKINEDGIFLLAQTSIFNYTELSSEYIEITNKALSMNKNRWCTWMNHDFQLLRYPELKKIYCDACKP